MAGRSSGAARMQRNLARIRDDYPNRAGRELYIRGEEIMLDSKDHYVPVDDGVLKNTGIVSRPVYKGKEIRVTLSYGGPAAPYALDQHETESFNHTIGEWKYLETPLMKAVRSMARDLARSLRLR